MGTENRYLSDWVKVKHLNLTGPSSYLRGNSGVSSSCKCDFISSLVSQPLFGRPFHLQGGFGLWYLASWPGKCEIELFNAPVNKSDGEFWIDGRSDWRELSQPVHRVKGASTQPVDIKTGNLPSRKPSLFNLNLEE